MCLECSKPGYSQTLADPPMTNNEDRRLPGGKSSFSIEGEDLIAAQLLRDVDCGFYVEVGANHPVTANNTYRFYRMGWQGIAIDGNSDYAAEWQEMRPRDFFVSALVSNTEKEVDFSVYEDPTIASIDPSTVSRYNKRYSSGPEIRASKTTTLKEILSRPECQAPKEIHLLAVDVEGEDENVLAGADIASLRPGVILVETKNLSLSRPSDHGIFRLLSGLGYKFVAKTPLDSFFVLPEKAYLRWIPNGLL